MTDLLRVLPDFPTTRYGNLLPAIEKQRLTTAELLTLDVAELGKRTQLPLLDLKRFCNAILEALHGDLGVSDGTALRYGKPRQPGLQILKRSGAELAQESTTISTLDDDLDRALGGGVPVGYVTEIAGEAGAGKTQFLLTLLLACQLPSPRGLNRPALYISTEAPLSTRRLSQILGQHPLLRNVEATDKPSLDNIISAVTPDLESQDHILQFQVPVEVQRRNIGLIVLDSVAANYRAEFDRGLQGSRSNLGARSAELMNLGQLLQDLARKHNLAVVVANQVADRFSSSSSTAPPLSIPRAGNFPVSQDSPLASRSRGLKTPLEPPSSLADGLVRSSMPEPPPEEPLAPPILMLDHQQRWFTGWGDDPRAESHTLKTPSLGLVWSTQIACRVALFRRPVYGRKEVVEDEGTGSATLRSWRRWMKVVFAPHVAPTGQGLREAVEFEVTTSGLRAVEKAN